MNKRTMMCEDCSYFEHYFDPVCTKHEKEIPEDKHGCRDWTEPTKAQKKLRAEEKWLEENNILWRI